MLRSDVVTKISERLVQRYKGSGQQAVARLQIWLAGEIPYGYPEIIDKHLREQHIDLLFDAFWQVLPFGTGGRRGRVGYGPNRLNHATIAMTVQGHCQYLRNAYPGRRDMVVVIAHDVRVFHDIAGVYEFLGDSHPLIGVSSRTLAKLACEIYAGNGIHCFLPSPLDDTAVLTTPELSYLIDRFDAVGGINISASHNPPDDNGIKIYDQHGSQPVAPHDQQLMDSMEHATNVCSTPFDDALQQGMVLGIPDTLHQDYVKTYVTLHDNIHAPQQDVPVIYTPLCGCGLTTVGDVFTQVGLPFLVPPNEGPDGMFTVIPFKAPNPEVFQATEPARAFADAEGVGIVLSSDPDADRVGLEVKLQDGSWYHFDGNQIAAVLCYFLMLDPQGPQRKGLVIETLVTTKMLGAIVAKAGESWIIDDLLVGFKYVADVLKTLERDGRYRHVTCSPDQLVLAAEESHGIMVLPTIRDKDATPACLYLAILYQRLRREGNTILDYYLDVLEHLGGYADVNRSIMMVGADGVLRKDRIMDALRRRPPQVLAGQAVQKVVDYWNEDAFGPFVSESDKLPRNVVQMMTDRFVITVRPSGTEPKLKFYCQLIPGSELSSVRGMGLLNELRGKADSIACLLYSELLSLIDVSIGPVGLLLPDIIDLDRKCAFEQKTVPKLREKISDGSVTRLDDLHVWLTAEVSGLIPGADPLPALRAPVAYLCHGWSDELGSITLFRDLRTWAM
ncbi:MAG TPA: hypothetical protein EYM83_06925 [Nitrospirales bacterium]|nr:hypothetical protein [Nitrospirales bacterium]